MTNTSLTPRALPRNLSTAATTELVLSAIHDRIIGTIIGSALGDAIGLYTEFLSAQISREAYPARCFVLSPAEEATPFRRDYHRSPHKPGNWTDDTDHALLILLSFLHNEGKLDPQDFAARLSVWVSNGLRALDTLPLGLGRTVGSIVGKKVFTEDPEGTAYDVWVKGGKDIAPNGSLMRTHPLGIMCIGKSQTETFETAARFSVMTHVDPRCVISCAIGTDLVRGLALSEYTTETDIDSVIEAALAWYPPWAAEHNEELSREADPPLNLEELLRHVKAQDLAGLQLDDSQKMGYVYKCLGSGILSLRLAMRAVASSPAPLRTQATIFEEIITSLIMRGGDADTNACFAGALLGSCLGYKALPIHWREGLKYGEWLMGKAEGLSRTLGISAGPYNGKEDKDTAIDGGRGLLTQAQMEERFMRLQGRVAQEEQEYKKKKEAEEKKAKSLFSKFQKSK